MIGCRLSMNFNPRSLAGAKQSAIHCKCITGFQSTLPRGSDTINFMMLSIMIFQSTLPRGSDCISQFSVVFLGISIHAPSRERSSATLSSSKSSYFNPRSLAGARQGGTFRVLWCYFNPRSLAGATGLMSSTDKVKLFQSTLPRGSEH